MAGGAAIPTENTPGVANSQSKSNLGTRDSYRQSSRSNRRSSHSHQSSHLAAFATSPVTGSRRMLRTCCYSAHYCTDLKNLDWASAGSVDFNNDVSNLHERRLRLVINVGRETQPGHHQCQQGRYQDQTAKITKICSKHT